MRELPQAVVISGPTGIGKSQAALELAKAVPLEIISVDSVQVYRGLDIGTAKPDALARRAVAHHLIDIRDAADSYSAGDFVADAGRLIGEISNRGRLPVLVGGTMLYFRALFGGLAAMPLGDTQFRQHVDNRAALHGWPTLHAELAAIDPIAASRIHPNDPQRIQRALEVHALTGRTITQLQAETRAEPVASFLRIALVPSSRSELHERLRRRLTAMFAAGFVGEVQALHARADLSRRSNAVRAVGYQQLWQHLDGDFGLEQAQARVLAATRQLAKRQLTWINNDPAWLRVDADAATRRPTVCELVRDFLSHAWLPPDQRAIV